MGFDELCKQDKHEQRRICTAVFMSEYFKEKITFSGANAVRRECKLRIVSFQTNYGASEAVKRFYREWMLPCYSEEDENNVDYLLSHAYRSNQIFVYSRDPETRNLFPDTLTIDVRIHVDTHKKKYARPNDTVFLDDYDT